MNIITYLSIDPNDKAKYDQLSYFNIDERRMVYWRCVVTFYATSIKCNPKAKHIFYTNDETPILDNGIDLKALLKDYGVEIRYLPFDSFRPPAILSTRFTNGFYKYTVIEATSKERDSSIILDNDCVWLRSFEDYEAILNQDIPVVYNPYDITNNPNEKNANGVSQKELGDFFKLINPSYSINYPTWYGGEFLSASPKGMKTFTEKLNEAFNYIIGHADPAVKLTLKGGISKKIFDGNEFILSYVLNTIDHKTIDPEMFIKRIWTGVKGEISQPKELQELVIWHLISEKTLGLNKLYLQVINENSEFWNINTDDLPEYLGGFFGIPERLIKIKSPNKMYVFIRKVISKLKHMKYEYSVQKGN